MLDVVQVPLRLRSLVCLEQGPPECGPVLFAPPGRPAILPGMQENGQTHVIRTMLLSGYLGAGKTTLLNHLLSMQPADIRVALIINEFGALGVDGQLVTPGPWAKFEINKGSLFCICVKTDLLQALQKIAAQTRPDLLIIEATGVAQPADIEELLEAAGGHETRFELAANLCMVDAEHFVKIAPFLKAAQSQVQWADGIIVNKADRANAAELQQLQAVLAQLNPQAPQTVVQLGRASREFLASLVHRRRLGELAQSPPQAILSSSVELPALANMERLTTMRQRLGERLLRLKGHADFGKGLRFVEQVGGEMTITHPRDANARRGLVAIAWQVRQAELDEMMTGLAGQ